MARKVSPSLATHPEHGIAPSVGRTAAATSGSLGVLVMTRMERRAF
jgi:hypothetical protein